MEVEATRATIILIDQGLCFFPPFPILYLSCPALISVTNNHQQNQYANHQHPSKTEILAQLEATRTASRRIVRLSDTDIAGILNRLAALTWTTSISSWQRDKGPRAHGTNPKYDRLLLNEERLADIANDLRKVAPSLPSSTRCWRNALCPTQPPDGATGRHIGIIFESRPALPFDVFRPLPSKSGNALGAQGAARRPLFQPGRHPYPDPEGAGYEYQLEDACYSRAPAGEGPALLPYPGSRRLYRRQPFPGQPGADRLRTAARQMPCHSVTTGAGIVHTLFR